MSEQFEILPRPSSSFLDGILGKAFPVLDHGFIRVIDYMGNDAAVVQAARVSYGKGTKKLSEDRGLIRYLLRNQHMTPFEMCEIKLHCKLPIFVARQWIRHRTANVNEYSARYSEIMDEFYVPEAEQIKLQSLTNKQGREGKIDTLTAESFRSACMRTNNEARELYHGAANEMGIAREISRINIPVSNYTQWYWKVDLRNLLGFLKLRVDSHAQYEIRVYAEAIEKILEGWVPLTMEAWDSYSKSSVTFSKEEWEIMQRFLLWKVGFRTEMKVNKGSLSSREKEAFEKLTGIELKED